MLEVCERLFSQWNSNNVKYCHWKSNEHLMAGLDGETDLDVYVAPSSKAMAETLLAECQYIECHTQEWHQYPDVFEWIGFDQATGCLVHVHLHYRIITGTKFCKEYVFPIDDLIISSRIIDPATNVYVTNPNLEIIILYSRIALKAGKKKAIRAGKSDCREIEYLKERIHDETVKELCVQLMGERGGEFFDLIKKGNLSSQEWYNIYRIASGWLKPYRRYSKWHVFLRHHYYKLIDLFLYAANKKYGCYYINRKTLPGHSVSVCLIGQDGSGKSTLTIELCKWLNWKLAAHRFYLGSGDHYNGFLKRVISKGVKIKRHIEKPKSADAGAGKTANPVKRKKNLKNLGPALIVAKNRLNIARRAYKEVLRSEKYRKKGAIPLFDRFPQNQFEGIYDGPKIAETYRANGLDYGLVKYMAKREQRYIEKIQKYQPRLIFKLMLSPEESIRRKPLENFDTVARKHEITRQLQFPNSTVHIVDATQNYQAELVFIKNEIWKSLIQNQ